MLFTRRDRYSDDEAWDRVQRDRDTLMAATAAAGAELPKNFASVSSVAALAALAEKLPGGRHRILIRETFEAHGPFGDEGTVRLFGLSEPTALTDDVPLHDLLDTDLNAYGPYSLAAEGKPLLGECWLNEAARAGRQAVYRLTFVDIQSRRELDPVTRQFVIRLFREPTEVDALLDPDRNVIAVHGGSDVHARRVGTLLTQALSTRASPVHTTTPPDLTDPMMHALVDGFDGWIPGGKIRPLNELASALSYGTRDQSESRRNLSNLRTRQEGEHLSLRAGVRLTRLGGRGSDRDVVFSIDRNWTLAFRSPVEPLVYFRVVDELMSLTRWRDWSRSVTDLAAQALKSLVGAASTEMDIQVRAGEYVSGVEQTIGPGLPSGMSEFRRRVVLVDVINAIWRIAPVAARLPAAGKVQPSAGLKTLFDDVARLNGGIIIKQDHRSAVVRAIWRALDATGGDHGRFLAACEQLTR